MRPRADSTDPTRLGTVEDVNGSSISVKLADDTASGLVFVNGEGYRVGQVGGFIRIPAGYVNLFGVVSQVGAGAAPLSPEGAVQALGNRWLRVELVGEGRRRGRFERGISQYPSIGDPVHVVTEKDLKTVYEPGNEESAVAVGRVASAESIRAYVDLNRLVSRHSALLGSTGSGKSTAVAGILGAIANRSRFPGARVLLLDLHGEYAVALGKLARVFRCNADLNKGEKPLYVPFWALSGEEFVAATMGTASSTQLAPLIERIVALKRTAKPKGVAHGVPAEDVSFDTPLPFCVHSLWHELHCAQYSTHTVAPSANQSEATRAWQLDDAGQPQKGDALRVKRPAFRATKNVEGDKDKVYKSALAEQPRNLVDTLEARLRDPRLQFLFSPGDWSVDLEGSSRKDLDALLDDWLGGESAISIFDLSAVPASVVEELIGAILRIVFDAAFWGRFQATGARSRPVLLVLEEAHRYLGPDSKSRAAVAARRVAKEGRKYGCGLMLVSQRPSELDSTILSQCGTLVALRLTNDSDREKVKSCASDNLKGLFAMLPILRTGEALIVGEAVNMPIRALIELPPEGRRPDSDDPMVVVPKGSDGKRVRSGGWTEPVAKEDFRPLVDAWRRQDAKLSGGAVSADAAKAGTKKG
jgi:uncharacterized protein